MNFATSPTSAVVTRLKKALAGGDRRGINGAIAILLERGAPLAAQWRSIAQILQHNGEHRAAVQAIRLFVGSQGNVPGAQIEEVYVLHRAGRIAEARALLDSLPTGIPDAAANAYLRGTLDSLLGNFDAAREELLAATRMAPHHGQFWLALAMVVNPTADPDIAARIEAADLAGMRDRDAYLYARGKMLADRGTPDAAFAAFGAGATIAATKAVYDEAGDRAAVPLVHGYDADFIVSVSERIDRTPARPIFVTGNPRSGTTLVEQILASHSAVADGDELGLMRLVGQDVGGAASADLKAFVARGGSPDGLAKLYLHLLDERFGPGGRIVDKTLTASRTLGLVAALLPEAPLIWMRRDPLDTAWSCFRTYFVTGNEWSWSLEAIAQHFLLEDQLLAHWQSVLGARLLVLDYEALVKAPGEVIPTLLQHCDLTPEPAVFEPERNRRTVRTASVTQVRRPINRDGIGAAEPYRRHLQPFVDAYRAAGGTIDEPG